MRVRERERAIVSRIVLCLAAEAGVEPGALRLDLEGAGGAIDPPELARILPRLSAQLRIELAADDREVAGALSYVDDLAALVLRRMVLAGADVRRLPVYEPA